MARPGETRFSCSMDRVTALTTLIVWASMIGGGVLIYEISQRIPEDMVWLLLIAAPMALVPPLIWAYSPAGYGLTRSALLIHRRAAPPITVPFAEITGAAAFTPTKRFNIRTVSGVHGYFGPFAGPDGKFLFYASRRSPLIRVDRTIAKPLVLSPDAHNRFLQELTARLDAR